MLLFIVMTSIIAVGLIAIARAHPPRTNVVVWNDETERRLLNERKITLSGW
jgi:hypothetical protein